MATNQREVGAETDGLLYRITDADVVLAAETLRIHGAGTDTLDATLRSKRVYTVVALEFFKLSRMQVSRLHWRSAFLALCWISRPLRRP
jgi:hypothetical protein